MKWSVNVQTGKIYSFTKLYKTKKELNQYTRLYIYNVL